ETHKRGMVLVVHANAVESWWPAINAHADVIAHGLWHWPGDRMGVAPPSEARDVIQAASKERIGVQPTLQAVYGDLTIFDRSILNDPRLKESLPRVLIEYLNSDEAAAAAEATADEYREAIEKLFGPGTNVASVMSTAPKRATATLQIMVKDKVKLLFGT